MGENLPTPGLFVDEQLKTQFRAAIDQLIADLGRPVKLFFKPTASGCPNCFAGPDGNSNGRKDPNNPFGAGQFNKNFPNGGLCPVCMGTHKIIIKSNTSTYTATIGKNPKDIDVSDEGLDPENVVKTKMVLESLSDVRRAEKALIDGDIYVILRDPITRGLQDLRYVITWWRKLTEDQNK